MVRGKEAVRPETWPAASHPVIETINRVLRAAGERFDGLTLTNTKTYFTAHISGEGPRTRTDWCFWPMGEFFMTEVRESRSSDWDSRLGSIQGLELLEYNTSNGGRYKLKVFPNCGEDGITAILDLASGPFSRKAGWHSRQGKGIRLTRKGKKASSQSRSSVIEGENEVAYAEGRVVPQDDAEALESAADQGDAEAQRGHAETVAWRTKGVSSYRAK